MNTSTHFISVKHKQQVCEKNVLVVTFLIINKCVLFRLT